MTRTYTTLADLVDQEIAPAFGEYGNDYDLDGFVRALRDADVIIYVQHGFQLVTDDDGQTPGFWELAATFDTSAN